MKKTKKIYCLLKNKPSFDIGSGHPMYCCQEWIDGCVNEDAVPISYHADIRQYYLICDSRVSWVQKINHCLYCNHKFPEDLYAQYSELLEKEHGLDEVTAWRYPERVPEEFKSEEWWKKRGL